jgi:hypothetical protein
MEADTTFVVNREHGGEPTYQQVEEQLRVELGIFGERQLREELIVLIARVHVAPNQPGEQDTPLSRLLANEWMTFEPLRPE